MTVQIALLLVILVAATTLYVTRWLAIEVTAILTIVALAATGILTPDQAFSGFSNSATLTVAAMFVLSGGLLRTGALEMVTRQLSRFSQGNPVRPLSLLAVVIPFASAFVNNTPVVVMMVPVILSLSRQFHTSPSQLLLPVSYFAILGGTLTLLGTSTNILVDGIYRQMGGPGFSLFEFTPLGLIYSTIGTIYILLTSQRLLPDNPPPLDLSEQQGTVYTTEVVITADSNIVGAKAGDVVDHTVLASPKTVPMDPATRKRRVGRTPGISADQEKEGELEGKVALLEVVRAEQVYRAEAAAELELTTDDVLLLTGTPNALARFLQSTRVNLATVLVDDQRIAIDAVEGNALEQKAVEAVVLPDSPFIGHPLGTLGFYQRYGVAVMGLQRRGRQRLQGIRNLRLQVGDVLLLRGTRSNLQHLREAGELLLVEGVEQTILRSTKNRQALLIMLGVVLAATLTEIPIAVLALAGAALMIITHCLRPDEALRSLDAPTLFLLAGTIPLGLGMESTGLAAAVVQEILVLTGGVDPRIFLSIFYLLTSVLTEIISNNAVAVLLTPIALQLATTLGVNPEPLLISIAFGASASFMTPMGYQTNAIVMGPGGYTFKNYLKFGVPLNIVMWITATVFIPILWPL